MKAIKHHIKEWTKSHFGDPSLVKKVILEEIQSLDGKEEIGQLEESDILRRV